MIKMTAPIRIHPGEMLREEFLKPLKISVNALSIAIGVPTSRIHEIIKERRGISADTALRLSLYFGNSAQFWLNLQNTYDIFMLQDEHAEEFKRIPAMSKAI
jgi:addiction module HigA family antidote